VEKIQRKRRCKSAQIGDLRVGDCLLFSHSDLARQSSSASPGVAMKSEKARRSSPVKYLDLVVDNFLSAVGPVLGYRAVASWAAIWPG
jgi:hypothetical protein